MLNLHRNHKNLVVTSFIVFAGLSTLIAVWPAYQMQDTQPLPAMAEFSKEESMGLQLYVKENCMVCHTQQVRNIEMDKVWGARPSIASDFYFSKARMDVWRQSPSILGSERTGPDLTNVGQRKPGQEWHFLHLYNPRIVVKESVMPAYPWLFVEKDESQITSKDIVVPVPQNASGAKNKKIVATRDAIHLVRYLQSLKQAPLPGDATEDFIPYREKKETKEMSSGPVLPDGEKLYMQTCSACHQADGKGLPGAFPPLAKSSVVTDKSPETLIKIILQGYDARTEFGVMPPFADQLTDEEIAAIASYERSHWGNDAPAITGEDVKQIRNSVTPLNQ
jgi:Cbb3-type cytochrome oxidase, cytochrome c subunit